MPPILIHPLHLDTPICSESSNRVFILLVHKIFSYFRGSHRGLSDLGGVHMPPMFIHPHTFGHPQYVQRVLIGYLFCYIIKYFPTLEEVMGVVRLRGCPYDYGNIPPVCLDAPICLDAPKCMGASKHTGGI